jgi:hypothetical protein
VKLQRSVRHLRRLAARDARPNGRRTYRMVHLALPPSALCQILLQGLGSECTADQPYRRIDAYLLVDSIAFLAMVSQDFPAAALYLSSRLASMPQCNNGDMAKVRRLTRFCSPFSLTTGPPTLASELAGNRGEPTTGSVVRNIKISHSRHSIWMGDLFFENCDVTQILHYEISSGLS